MYAAIRNLPKSRATAIMTGLGLTEHKDKQAKELSGGSKRKLLVGIALLSSGSVLFFDEPSCGVDPATRQLLWAAIASATARRVLLLTTHSMVKFAMFVQCWLVRGGSSSASAASSKNFECTR